MTNLTGIPAVIAVILNANLATSEQNLLGVQNYKEVRNTDIGRRT